MADNRYEAKSLFRCGPHVTVGVTPAPSLVVCRGPCLKGLFLHARMFLTRLRNAFTASVTVTATRSDGSGLFGESVFCVTRTADSKSLLVVCQDGNKIIIPFEELTMLLVTAY